jgi:uncharacterized protein YbjT (DUF2867 family)
VRGTTRDPGRAAAIAAAGAEAFVGDPDRVATLAPALEHVTVACILLGSVSGRPDHVAELHGPRLAMLLTRMLDTTVHAIVYEASGTVDAEVLQGGARRIVATCEASRIPHALLRADPGDHQAWVSAARGAVRALFTAPEPR